MIRTRRAALAQSVQRFSEKIMLNQESGARWAYPSRCRRASSAVRNLRESVRNACQKSMIRRSGNAPADHVQPRRPSPSRETGLGGSFRAARHFRDRLQDLRGDLVGVALRVRTAVFQITLVAVVDEGVRNADRGTTISHAVAELVPRCGLVLARQTLVVVGTIDRDVVVEILV